MTLANSWENAKVASPWCAFSPRTKMSMSPKTRNVAGASHRRTALTGAAPASSTVGTRSVVVMRPIPSTE